MLRACTNTVAATVATTSVSAAVATSAISATGTPLPYAIAYYAHLLTTLLRCKLASHKTKLLQTHCPSDHPASLARLLHLFPADTTIVADGHLILAGCPYGSPAGVRTALRPAPPGLVSPCVRAAAFAVGRTPLADAALLPGAHGTPRHEPRAPATGACVPLGQASHAACRPVALSSTL